MSPSILSYIKVASDLRILFVDFIEGADIATRGVGYGGQRQALDQLYRCRSFDLFDPPSVLGLVSEFLERHLLQFACQAKMLTTHGIEKYYSLSISNYAYAEFPAPVQSIFIEKVL